MGHFFIENPVGVLILGILGAIVGGLCLEKRHQLRESVVGKITREGFGYNLIRGTGHLVRVLIIIWMTTSAFYVHKLSGFSNGVIFLSDILLGIYYLGMELKSCGITIDWAFERWEATVKAMLDWAKPKSASGKPDATPTSIEQLIEHLDSSIYLDSQLAERQLRGLAGKAAQPLIDALSTNERIVFSSICQLLGQINDPRAVPPLMEALEKGNYSEKMSAAIGLSYMPREATKLLAEALRSDDVEITGAAAFSLGLTRDIRSVKPLLALSEKAIKQLKSTTRDMRSSQYGKSDLSEAEKYTKLIHEVSKLEDDPAWAHAESAAAGLASLAEMALKKR